jgi:hypothetical protein
LYQGTTLVVPQNAEHTSGFSPCIRLIAGAKALTFATGKRHD